MKVVSHITEVDDTVKDRKDMIKDRLKSNGGYCPCKIDKVEDNLCICKEFRDKASGTCHCGLYKKYTFEVPKYVAVDFDGTLCEHKFPGIGKPNKRLIEYVRILHSYGSKIILYTCREDGEKDFSGNSRDYLSEAVAWCKENDIPLDAVNENPWVPFGGRKIYADIYVDDRNVNHEDFYLGGVY